MSFWTRLFLLVSALVLAGCDFAPPYAPPTAPITAHFKNANMLVANPSDHLPRGPWWTAFRDSTLDSLEPQVDDANQTLAVAFANYQLARTQVQTAEASLFPTLDQQTLLSTNRQSDHREYRPIVNQEFDYYGVNSLTIQSTYEVDLWGRVRDTIKANAANAQSQAALLESVRLSLHAQTAREYVALRGIDRDLKLLRDTVKNYEAALKLTEDKLAAKIASDIDVERARQQLAAAKSLIEADLDRRALLEHSIAVLIGRPASDFSIPVKAIALTLPRGPAATPSTLLERRPDIAAAERQVAAANEGIGIAKTAFYPRFFLNLYGGTQDRGIHLLDLNNELFQIGPSITLPIFDGGARSAQLTAAYAQHDQTIAQYRQTVLQAVKEVEDALSSERHLTLENRQIEVAVAAGQKVVSLSLDLYRDGAANYLDVVVAQENLLTQQRASVGLQTGRLNAAVSLFVALGGGWTTDAGRGEKS